MKYYTRPFFVAAREIVEREARSAYVQCSVNAREINLYFNFDRKLATFWTIRRYSKINIRVGWQEEEE